MTRILASLLILSTFTTPHALAESHGQGKGENEPGGHFVEMWDLDGDGQVTLAEATERRGDIFVTFDADENGVLDAEEHDFFDEARANDVKENGKGHGRGKNNPANGMLRDVTDANADGEVSLSEFLDAVPGWFNQIDRNGDGVVTTEDFGRLRG